MFLCIDIYKKYGHIDDLDDKATTIDCDDKKAVGMDEWDIVQNPYEAAHCGGEVRVSFKFFHNFFLNNLSKP